MKRVLLSLVAILGLFVISLDSMGQAGTITVVNITYSHPSAPPFTVSVDAANSFVPPCGSNTGTLKIDIGSNILPAGTVFTLVMDNQVGQHQSNNTTTVSNGQSFSQIYSNVAGSATGVLGSIIIKTPKLPPAFNDSTYIAQINFRVISSVNFKAQVIPVNPLCPVPPNKGSASVSIISGTAPYNYTWSVAPNTNPGNVASAPNLDPGSYSVYVKDASGCDTTMPFTLIVQKPTVNLTSNPTGPICNPTFPLSITWTATPGPGWTPNPAGAYSWDGGVTFITQNTQTQSGILTYGTYNKTVIFKDINNCLSAQVGLTVPVDTKPQVTAVASPASVCPGTTTSITATLIPPCSAIGATCSFSYDNGATYVASNTYTTFPINQDTVVIVKVQNSTGCVSNPFPVSIDTSGKPRIIPVASPSPICPNASYSITSTCANNCAAIQMSFNNGALVAGSPQTYNQPTAPLVGATTTFPMYAIGANGCRFDTTVTVTVFTNTLTISPPPAPICANNNGSTVTLTASGFKPASTVTWTSTPSGLPGDGSHATSIVVSSPSQGSISYMLTGTDVNNCPRTVNQSITVNPQPTVTETGPAWYCQGQATPATLTGGGASTYQWYDGTFITLLSGSGSTFNVTPVATTTYGVIGTDANGCKDSATFVLVYHSRPTGTASANPTAICSGNTVTITMTLDAPFNPDLVNGSYSINNGVNYSTNPVFSGVGPLFSTTIINTMLQDNFQCLSLPIPVTVTINPFHYKATGTSPNCSYNTNGSISISNLVGGTSPNANYTITPGSASPTAFTTSANIPNLAANSYLVHVFDNSSPACSFDTTVTIVVPAPINFVSAVPTDVKCRGDVNGSILATVSGGTPPYNYLIYNQTTTGLTQPSTGNPSTTYTYTGLGVTAGNTTLYDVIVQDASAGGGCKDTITGVAINQPASTLVAPTITPPSFCYGSSTGVFTLSPAATGGWGTYTYTFNGSVVALNGTVSNLAAGSYPLVVTDLKGCQVSTTVTLIPSPKLSSNITTASSNCGSSGSITYGAASGGTPGYYYSLDGVNYGALNAVPPSQIGNVNVNTTVTLYVKDSQLPQGCKADTTVTVLNIPRGIPIISIKAPLCPNGNDGSITVDSTHSKIAPPNGAPYDFKLFKDQIPQVSVGTFTGVAANASVTFSSLTSGDYIMKMSDRFCPDYTVDSFRVYTSPSSYIVVKAPAIKNPSFADMSVPEPAGFTTTSISLASDINKSTGSIILYNLTGGAPYLVSGNNAYDMSVDNPTALVTTALKDTLNGQKYVSFSNLAPGAKTIYIRDANGCLDTIQVIVPGKFFIPNLVSPNGDAHNDAFEVVSLPDNSSLKILNRWGDRVYSSSNYDNKFDFHGLSDGVYYYDLEFDTGTKFKGWVQVLR